MKGLIFLTNMDRQYSMMEQAKNNLLKEGRLPFDSKVISLRENSVWGIDWQKKIYRH